jgi:hypothetical protein
MFDRSGQVKFDAMIQIPDASNVRILDFTTAPDGSVWASGLANATGGQRSFFLAHITNDGQPVQIIRTNPYQPSYLTVAPDGTVWTMGYALAGNRVDKTQDSLRHFDASGKLIASAVPAGSLNLLRMVNGYLDFYQGRLVWYSPISGSNGDRTVPDSAFVEISPTDLTVLSSYPGPPRNWNDYIDGFAVTPSGRAFAQVYHPRAKGRPELYELDRGRSRWALADGPLDQSGHSSSLEGCDAESLVFSDLRGETKQKLQVVDLLKDGRPQ